MGVLQAATIASSAQHAPHSLETASLTAENVRAALWPGSARPAPAISSPKTTGPLFPDLSLGQLHDVEEWLRPGPVPTQPGPSAPPDATGILTLEVSLPGQRRIPVLVRPPSHYQARRSWPLLLAMHGGPVGDAAAALAAAHRMMNVWSRAAEQHGWFVVAPAMTMTVAAGPYTPQRLPYEIFHPEEARAVIQAIRSRYRINPDRLVPTGISLGSNFSIAFAAANPDRFAAIVPVSTEGDSRESLLRDLTGVPVYILEGSRDQNIRKIAGPRAMASILNQFGADLVYREFADRSHEGFQDHYDDVLRWLDARPRRLYPHRVLRIPHQGIMPLSRRLYWVKIDTRQGLIKAEITGRNRIDITARRVRRITLYLHDRLVDLDHEVEIIINGVPAWKGRLSRSLSTLLEQARELGDERRLYPATLALDIPTTASALEAGRRLSTELAPRKQAGTLSFWEMYAGRALEERFSGIGFEGTETRSPAEKGEQVGIKVNTVAVDSPAEAAGLKPGDIVWQVGGEPFYQGQGGVAAMNRWLRRELRTTPAPYTLDVTRRGSPLDLQVQLQLGSYTGPTSMTRPVATRTGTPPHLHPAEGRALKPPSSASAPVAGRPFQEAHSRKDRKDPQRGDEAWRLPRASRLIRFDHYHTMEEIETYLQNVTAAHAGISRLLRIGKSLEGRSIMAVEINDPSTGAATDKPGFYVDGNIHGGELLGGEAVLHFMDVLLNGNAGGGDLKDLLRSTAFYMVPVVNPDGREISVTTPENHRWNLTPVDQDGDGRMDEDPPEDLDSDGRILKMRVKDPKGQWRISPADPRLMIRRQKDPGDGHETGPFFSLYTEGLDNDHDGRFNEDIIGGIDVNRNFPANWIPSQFAAGPYPLSEPESRALVEYITQRPSISAIHTFHTSGGMILRFPTLAGQDWDFPAEDLKQYNSLAQHGGVLTGYDNFAFKKKKIVDLMHPGHGVFNDWASSVFGVFAITTELWKHPWDDAELLAWNDQVLGGRGFVDWHPFHHPQLGDVELGGWDRFAVDNPPEALIKKELQHNTRWMISFAGSLPRVSLVSVSTRTVHHASDLLELDVEVANSGRLPTSTRYARETLKIAPPITVQLDLDGADRLSGEARRELPFLAGAGDQETGPVQRFSWTIRRQQGHTSTRATIIVSSQKAGTIRKMVKLWEDAGGHEKQKRDK